MEHLYVIINETPSFLADVQLLYRCTFLFQNCYLSILGKFGLYWITRSGYTIWVQQTTLYGPLYNSNCLFSCHGLSLLFDFA